MRDCLSASSLCLRMLSDSGSQIFSHSRTTPELFPENFFEVSPKMIFDDLFLLISIFLTRISVSISFFSTMYMSNYKHLTNINQFYFATKLFFHLFGGPACRPPTAENRCCRMSLFYTINVTLS